MISTSRGAGPSTQRAAEQRTALSPRRVCEPWVEAPKGAEPRSGERTSPLRGSLNQWDLLTQGSQTRLGPERCPLLRSWLISDPRGLSLLKNSYLMSQIYSCPNFFRVEAQPRRRKN